MVVLAFANSVEILINSLNSFQLSDSLSLLQVHIVFNFCLSKDSRFNGMGMMLMPSRVLELEVVWLLLKGESTVES